jgi:hypothetical protein
MRHPKRMIVESCLVMKKVALKKVKKVRRHVGLGIHIPGGIANFSDSLRLTIVASLR